MEIERQYKAKTTWDTIGGFDTGQGRISPRHDGLGNKDQKNDRRKERTKIKHRNCKYQTIKGNAQEQV